jgi:hypothetical protein
MIKIRLFISFHNNHQTEIMMAALLLSLDAHERRIALNQPKGQCSCLMTITWQTEPICNQIPDSCLSTGSTHFNRLFHGLFLSSH